MQVEVTRLAGCPSRRPAAAVPQGRAQDGHEGDREALAVTVVGVLHPGEMGRRSRAPSASAATPSSGRPPGGARRRRNGPQRPGSRMSAKSPSSAAAPTSCSRSARPTPRRKWHGLTSGFRGIYVDANAIAPGDCAHGRGAHARALRRRRHRRAAAAGAGQHQALPRRRRSRPRRRLFAGTNVDARVISGRARRGFRAQGRVRRVDERQRGAAAHGPGARAGGGCRGGAARGVAALDPRARGARWPRPSLGPRKGWRWIGEMEEIASSHGGSGSARRLPRGGSRRLPRAARSRSGSKRHLRLSRGRREKVDPKTWCYFEGGAGDEFTLRGNVAAYERCGSYDRGCSSTSAEVTTATTVLARDRLSLGIAPVA